MCIPFSTISILENISLDFTHLFWKGEKLDQRVQGEKAGKMCLFWMITNECSRIMLSLF